MYLRIFAEVGLLYLRRFAEVGKVHSGDKNFADSMPALAAFNADRPGFLQRLQAAGNGVLRQPPKKRCKVAFFGKA